MCYTLTNGVKNFASITRELRNPQEKFNCILEIKLRQINLVRWN